MAVGEAVVLVNRTKRPLTVLYNGRARVLKPGKNPATTDWIRFAKTQHPRMGSFIPGTLDGEYLVGVEGVDDCTPIVEGGKEGPIAIERFSRAHDTVDIVATGERDPKRMNVTEFSNPVPEAAGFNGR